MDRQQAAITVGTGLTSFLLVAGLVTAGLDPYIAFSVFIGIPVGLIAGAIGITAAASALGRDPSRLLTSAFAGVAGFGYTVLVVVVIRFVAPGSRQALGVELLSVIAGFGAVVAFVVVWLRGSRTG